MASVWKHPNSPFWTAIYRDEENHWRKKSTKLTNRTKALAVSIEWERAGSLGRDRVLTESVSREVIGGILERTTDEKLRQTTTREYCAAWTRGKTLLREDRTTVRYEGTVRKFLKFLGPKADKPIVAVTAGDCQRFHDSLMDAKLAPASVVVEMKTIGMIFNKARRINLVTANPVTAVELPERFRQVSRKTFTPEQIRLLLAEADGEWRTAILLGYYAGLRLGDAVSLTWENVDFVASKLLLETQKTDTDLEIPLHPTLEAHLSKLAEDKGGELCPTLSANTVGGRSGLSKQFLAIMRRAGISNDSVKTGGTQQLSRLSFHALRTTFNSALHNKGVDQELRKKLTGHKSDAVNDRYTRTEMDTLRAAVNKLPGLSG